MKRKSGDQPIIRRPKTISLVQAKSFERFPTSNEKRILFMDGAKEYEAILIKNKENVDGVLSLVDIRGFDLFLNDFDKRKPFFMGAECYEKIYNERKII